MEMSNASTVFAFERTFLAFLSLLQPHFQEVQDL
jgi:hypothetical protein